jgi:TusA-related sulfurtransferase
MKADKTLDTRGLVYTLALIKARKAMDLMMPGEVLEMVSTDPALRPDLQKLVDMLGHELLDGRTEDGVVYLYIRLEKRSDAR